MTETTPSLIDGPDEVLRRQVPPQLIDPTGSIMKTAFMPSERDAEKLSTLRGSVDPAEAHRRYVEDQGYESVGTWGVVVGYAASLHLPSYDDSCLPENPEDHASVYFDGYTKGQQAQLGRKLRVAAQEAGPLYTPSEGT